MGSNLVDEQSCLLCDLASSSLKHYDVLVYLPEIKNNTEANKLAGGIFLAQGLGHAFLIKY